MPPPTFARVVPYLCDRYRYKRHLYHTLLRSVTFVGDHILRATEHLHQCYAHKIRTQTVYNETMGYLEETATICASVRDGLVLRGHLQLSGGAFVRARLQLADVIERLRWLGRRQGAAALHDLLQLEFGVDVVRTLSGWWPAFVQTTFVPLAYDVYRLPADATGTSVTLCELARNPFDTKAAGTSSSSKAAGTGKGKGKGKARRAKKRTVSRSSSASASGASSTAGSAAASTAHQAVDVARIVGLAGAVASVPTTTSERTHPCEQLCYLLHDGVTTESALVPTGGAKAGAGGSAAQTLLGFASPTKPGQAGVPQSLVETIHGARVYVPLWDQGYVVALSGTFRTDSFQTTMNHVPLFTKHRQLRQLVVQSSVIPEAFSAGWVQQLSLRDLLVYNARELSDQCIRDFQRLQQYKAKTISTLVKEFLSSPLALQRDILTLFLLTEQDSDTQYLAYLMYDMISQESYLLKPQPLAEEIYNHLHWCIKKRFKVVIENIQEFTKRLSTFTENDINYESRIFLMKAPDAVKKKAMEKLKEVQSKNGNETNHKAQQYLDGLLRVPFGIYRRERMFSFLQEFSHRIRTHCEQFCHATDADAQATEPLAVEHRALTDPQRRLTYERINTFLRTTVALADGGAAAGTGAAAPSSHPVDWAAVEAALAACTHGALSKRVTACKKALGVKALVYPSGEGAGQTKVQARVKGQAVAVPTLAAALTRYAQKVHGVADAARWAACVVALGISDVVEAAVSATTSAAASSTVVHAQFRDQLHALSTEWTQYKQDTQTYLKGVDDILEKSVFGHAKAKRSIKQVIAQWITGDLKGYCFGFEGPPGTGKTSLAKNGLSKCLVDVNGERRPFSFIALGGSSNGSTLEGHSYTYVGSIWGRIVDILMETECMNPIIYIDELDKVSRTEHGRELIGILTHITDSTQNEEFMDKYFAGIKIDLSRVLFVFSYNDPDLIDPILRDRIHVVRFSPLKQADKHEVCGRHLIPEILKTVGLGRSDLVFPQEVIDFIIDHYTAEGGVRRLKEKLFEICRDLNIRHLSDPKTYAFPYTVTPAFLKDDLFVEHPIVHRKRILASPRVGLTNGMYATTLGVGGITIIECFVVPKSSFMAMELTGQQGDVMKESMSVAKTVAWNLLTEETKGALCEASKANSIGLHVHCPDGGTPKDGPSAGTAITISILSSLLKCPVNNKVAITGEIDLNGQVCQIGGLDTKVRGAKKAGVQTVLFPASNAHDLQTIKKHYDPFDAEFKYAMVETIWDVLPYVFPGLGYGFVRF